MKDRARLTESLTRVALGFTLLGWVALARPFPFRPSQADVRPAENSSPAPGERDGEEREEWFYEQRAYPAETIPPGARLSALVYLEQEEARRKQLHLALGDETSALSAQPSWLPLGPEPIGQGQTFGSPKVPVSGRVAAMALDPGYNGTSNQTVYIGTANGGVWRSRDNGANWTPLTDNQPSMAIGALAIEPTNPNVIYAGTGEGNPRTSSYYGAGLLKSTDGGASWALITGPTSTIDPQVPAFINAGFSQLVIDPVVPSTVYACTISGYTDGASAHITIQAPLGQRGVWKSGDGGQTWKNLDPSGTGGRNSGISLVLDPLNHNQVWAAILSQGVYRSTGGGEPGTWTKLSGGLPAAGFERTALAVGPPLAPSANSTLYAAVAKADDSLLGIFKSTDNGANWAQVTSPISRQCNYNLALAVNPTNANIVYYGTAGDGSRSGGVVLRSGDGGVNWADLSVGDGTGGLHEDNHVIVISRANRNIVFTASDGGVWRSDNALSATVGWTSLNSMLSITQFQSVALHPTDPSILLGGTQDNGTNRYNGHPTWFHSADGDGGFALIDQSSPLVMYHTIQNSSDPNSLIGINFGPYLSTNGGDSWSFRGCRTNDCSRGFNSTDRVGFYAPLAEHMGFTPNVIYAGTHRLYRSANQGVTWTGLGASSDGFGADLTKGAGRLSAITAHPKLGAGSPPAEVVWVGTSDGLVQVTANAAALAGATFTNVTKPPLPNRFVTDIALDPATYQRAVATYSGFDANTPTTPGHVFLTGDGGATWRDISGTLPDTPVNSVVLDPLLPNTFYIGTDIGVFQTMGGGATWVRLANGMPEVPVFMLRYHAATRSLVAATHGRGMYRLTLAPAVVTASAASFSAGDRAGEEIVTAFGTRLATVSQAATTIPLPTTLSGTQVLVRDSAGVERPAPLFFVSANQVNYQIPPGTATGPATVMVTSGDGSISVGTAEINAVAPGLFAANSNGQGVAAAYAVRVRGGAQTTEAIARYDATRGQFASVPIDLGPTTDTVVLVLFGTGLRHRSALSAVSVRLGGVEAPVQYAGAQGGLVGLDQINVVVPRSLIGRGEIDVSLVAEGKTGNVVQVNIK